jgi:rubredoxin
MSITKYEKCPMCKNEMVEEVYNKLVTLHSCGTCGFPYMSEMMPYYKEKGQEFKLDFFYALLEYMDGKHGIEFERSPTGVMRGYYIPSMMLWSLKDEARGAILYAIINIAKDGSFYEFRGIYSNPYFAQDVCDSINRENERRGIKAEAHYEKIPVNHPCGSSMFEER